MSPAATSELSDDHCGGDDINDDRTHDIIDITRISDQHPRYVNVDHDRTHIDHLIDHPYAVDYLYDPVHHFIVRRSDHDAASGVVPER